MKRLGIAIAVCALAGAGCVSTRLVFEGSPLLPAADPRARIDRDRNHNSLVEIEIDHMAQAGSLHPPRNVYVVWAEGEGGRILPLGQLRVNEDREGRFTGVTALERFRILISAELDPQATQPSEPLMLVSDFVGGDER